jgi:hypothetical protein
VGEGGEKMRVKSVFTFMMLILMLVAIIPTISAAPTVKKIPVVVENKSVISSAITCQYTGISYPHDASAWWAANGFKDEGVVAQRRNDDYVRNFDLIIKYSTGDVKISGISFNELSRMWKYAIFNPDVPFPPATGAQNLVGSDSVTHFDAVWEFNREKANYGGFEGNINHIMKNYGQPGAYEIANFVLKGFGAFEGQTIQMTVDTRATIPWTGYLFTP